jgi:DNA-binding winged helix-turn-helix (wHTH) protein/TolB-like protein/Tfp pilus assembly protein PilF
MGDCQQQYSFGPFTLVPSQYVLLRNGLPTPLTPKAFEILVVLVQNHGRLLEKAELIQAVWHDTFVEEGNLSVMICLLRKTLGEEHKYIQTVAKRGYRFVAEVNTLPVEVCPFPPRHFEPKQLVENDPVRTESLVSPSPDVGAVVLESVKKESLVVSVGRRPRIFSQRALVSLGVAAGVILLATSVWVGAKAKIHAATSFQIRSLAVLPFETIGTETAGDYLGLGTADALIAKLRGTAKISTRSTREIQKYQNTLQDPRDTGREQGVDAVIDGCIQRAGDRVRVTAELVRVSDGAQLWSDAFDEDFINVFSVEDMVSARIASEIPLDADAKKDWKKDTAVAARTPNSDAYQSYLIGRYFWNERTGKGLEKSIDYLQHAIELDHTFAKAYAGMADSYAMLGLYTVRPPNEAFPKAKAAAVKALELDGDLAEAHATLGFVHFYYDWDGVAAEKEFGTALRLDPNYAMAHSWRGFNLVVMGRSSEAIREAKMAQAADPVSAIIGTNAAWVYLLAGEDDMARGVLQRVIELDPNFPRAHFRLGNVYEHMNKYSEAITEYEKAVSLSDGDTYYLGYLGHAYAMSKMNARADKSLRKLEELKSMRYVPPFAIALIYFGMGDKDHGFEFFENASADRSTSMAYIKLDPSLNSLHSDPRFTILLQRTNF